jgi:hypothetical protein
MRKFLALLAMLLAVVATVGDVRPLNANTEAATPQASPTTTPKCVVPPDAVGGCHISKHNKEFIRWQAPADADMYVCFPTRLFKRQNYHIRAGHHKDSGPIDVKPEPTSGAIIEYYYGPDPCPAGHRNSAKVIVED